MGSRKSFPVIDLEDDETVAEKIVKYCEEFGCFRVKNHGIPVSLMSDMKEVTASLMDLPLEVKYRNFNRLEPSKGYTPPNMASAFFDSLSIYDMASPQAVEDFCSLMDLSSYQREIIIKYTSAINELVKVMGSKLKEGLGLAGEQYQEGICQLKMNKYSYGPETVGLIGATMHSDAGLFTILYDDENVGGLEAVDHTNGQLISLDPLPGTFTLQKK